MNRPSKGLKSPFDIQLPDRVTVEHRIPPGLICPLPKDRFRQAILNLVWNSVEALGDGAGVVTITADGGDARKV